MRSCNRKDCSCCTSWRIRIAAAITTLGSVADRLKASLANNRDEAQDAQQLAAASACGDAGQVIWLRDRMTTRQKEETLIERAGAEEVAAVQRALMRGH